MEQPDLGGILCLGVAIVSLATQFDVCPVGWYNRRMERLGRTTQMIEGEVADLIVIRGQDGRPSVAEGTSPSVSTPLWSMKPPALIRRPVRPAFSAN